MLNEPVPVTKAPVNYSRSSYQLFIVLLLSISINLLLGIKLYKQMIERQLPPVETIQQVESTPSPTVQPTPAAQPSIDPSYLELERELLTQTSSNTQAMSKLFGFKFNSFHPDWSCNNRSLRYTNTGVVVSCTQKQCSLSDGLLYPDVIAVSDSPECAQELANREYPNDQLPRFEINVEKYVVEGELALDTNAVTPKGRPYKLEVLEGDKHQTGYVKQLTITFYSPNELTRMLSDLIGTLYGADTVYAKYTTTVGVYESLDETSEITEEKIIQLIEKMIDSIQFTEPIEL